MNEQVLIILFTGVVFGVAPIAWALRHIRRKHNSQLTLIVSSVGLVSFCIYAFFVGQYYFLGSYYLRFAVLGLGILVVLYVMIRGGNRPLLQLKGWSCCASCWLRA